MVGALNRVKKSDQTHLCIIYYNKTYHHLLISSPVYCNHMTYEKQYTSYITFASLPYSHYLPYWMTEFRGTTNAPHNVPYFSISLARPAINPCVWPNIPNQYADLIIHHFYTTTNFFYWRWYRELDYTWQISSENILCNTHLFHSPYSEVH